MSKIKVFEFEVCNSATWDTKGLSQEWLKRCQERLFNMSDIENTINDFLKDKKLIDIKINNVDVNYHNNGRTNTINLIYTILFE